MSKYQTLRNADGNNITALLQSSLLTKNNSTTDVYHFYQENFLDLTSVSYSNTEN